jgi:hypothetical protein
MKCKGAAWLLPLSLRKLLIQTGVYEIVVGG